jgi:UDP:flavonoid glycosyltransferase YjiC (YdhE family)
MMIALFPHGAFLSEVSRSIEIGRALQERGVPVVFASRGGPYVHLIEAAGFDLHPLDPPADDDTAQRFLDALLAMGPRTSVDFFTDDELRASVQAEARFLREVGASAVVTGFTLSAYLSTRLEGVSLITDHGGSFVPPTLARGLCPVAVNPPDPNLARLPQAIQRLLANRAPALIKSPVAQLNRHADELGLPGLPGMMALMCGDLTLITELPEVLGMSEAELAAWQPRRPFRAHRASTFRFTGPMYARLDLPIPGDVDAFLESSEPAVYLSPTSVREGFLRSMVARVKAAGVRMLVGATVHDVTDLADERTLVAGVLPNHLVMPRVAAAVIMGGQGSVQTAMASGTPFVGLTYHGEQELNVAVAERMGMAIRLAPQAAETPALTVAIRRLLDDKSYATAAAVAAGRYRGADGAGAAAEVIVDWLEGVRTAGAPATRRRRRAAT